MGLWISYELEAYEEDTEDLDFLQDAAYMRLLRYQWKTGKPIESERAACRIISAIEHAEQDACAYALNRYFVKTDKGFINPRAMKTYEETQKRLENKKRAAASRWGSKETANAPANADENAAANADENARAYAPASQHKHKQDLDLDLSKKRHTHRAHDADVSVCVGLKVLHDGVAYAEGSGNTAMKRYAWVKGYLKTKIPEIREQYPGITDIQILDVWRETCDLASSHSAKVPAFYQKTFDNKLDDWKPKTSGGRTAQKPKQNSVLTAWLSKNPLRFKETGEVVESKRLKIVDLTSKETDDPSRAVAFKLDEQKNISYPLSFHEFEPVEAV
jgi:uncharacterized protein YdaU (DUF1376 family)